MTRRMIMVTALLAACSFGVLSTAGQGQIGIDPQRAGSQFKPVMGVHDLMEEQGRHFKQIVELIKNSDVEERFEKIRHSALALGEMANVNTYQKRADEHPGYRKLAERLKRQSVELAEFAAAEKIVEARTLAKNINKTCSACHDKFSD